MKILGKRVVDAKSPLILDITPDDVRHGKSKKSGSCAAAVACVRQLKAQSARVHLARVYVEFKDGWVRYATPQTLRTEIVSFDRGHSFETGEYRIRPLSPSQQAGHPARVGNSSSGNRKGKTKRKGPLHHTKSVRASALHTLVHPNQKD